MSDISTETTRRLDNLIRRGTVTEIDHTQYRCRVKTGGLLTDWLPWLAVRAGETKTWCPPTAGEQVVIFAPGGELATGFVLTGLYSDANPPPEPGEFKHWRTWPDGGYEMYDHHEKKYLLNVPFDGALLIRCGASYIEMDAKGIRIKGVRLDLNKED